MKKLSAFHSSVIGFASLWLLLVPQVTPSQELTKIAFPYGPLGLNSMPWVIARDARLFEKNGLDVDMVYVGASAVIVQSMLSGCSNVAGFGGPAVVTNVLRGGDIIQVAAMAPFFTQSLFVRSDIRDLRAIQGKKIGITRFGSVTDFALRTILERHNLKDVNILQMGGFPEAVAGLSRGAIDGALFSPPHNLSPVSGFPAIVVPAGFTREVYDRVPDAKDPNGSRLEGPKPDQIPMAMEFLARPFDEPTLFEIASAYEAGTKHRRPPKGFGPLKDER
jgi:ABC-type nitrate/sulfonate/bicarbonate transport system substrate-binding protein